MEKKSIPLNDNTAVQSLDKIHKGSVATVHLIEGGWRIRQKLNQMGIHCGDEIRIKNHGYLGGPTLIEVHGSQVAVGRGMAKKILVQIHASS